jgi:hypothetical protein
MQQKRIVGSKNHKIIIPMPVPATIAASLNSSAREVERDPMAASKNKKILIIF